MRLRSRVNAVLSALIAILGFTGCHSQKTAQKQQMVEPIREATEPEIRLMYGVPSREVFIEEPADTLQVEEATEESTEEEQPQQKIQEDPTVIDRPVMVKYGVPANIYRR